MTTSQDGPRRRPPRRDRDDEPVLPDTTSDERDTGWGEDARDGRRNEDWYRRERPPHHGD